VAQRPGRLIVNTPKSGRLRTVDIPASTMLGSGPAYGASCWNWRRSDIYASTTLATPTPRSCSGVPSPWPTSPANSVTARSRSQWISTVTSRRGPTDITSKGLRRPWMSKRHGHRPPGETYEHPNFDETLRLGRF